jgi:FtsH-binding integral membrane protein
VENEASCWKFGARSKKKFLKGRAKMAKVLRAFLLGLFAFVFVWAIGEAVLFEFGYAGIIATFILTAACFFICQFFLSRDNPDAYRKDWAIMSALSVVPLLIVIFALLWERRMGVRIFISSLVGTFAGAVAASLIASRKSRRPLE